MNEYLQSTPLAPACWRTVTTSPAPCYEWTAHDAPPAALGPEACRAGCATRGPEGADIVLHPAPDRWLVAEASAAIVTDLRAAEREGLGVLTEVTGKWRRIRITPLTPDAGPHPLSAAMPLELMLAGRECAALWVYDCPAVVVRCAGEVELWVEASYEASAVSMLATLGATG